MIWESQYWKRPLLRLASKLTRWSTPRDWTEPELVSIEKDIFIAFYSIRKLMDAKKLSNSIETMAINVGIHPNQGKDVTLLNWDKIDMLYDLAARKNDRRDLRFICNQVIHSYVFVPVISQDGSFEGILFCSDKERNKNLYRLGAKELIDTLRVAGKNYPSEGKRVFNPKKRDYDVTNW